MTTIITIIKLPIHPNKSYRGGASEYAYGTFRGIGLQFKNLSIVMKAVGQQMQRRSESLKNAAPNELEFSTHTGSTKNIGF